MGIYIFVLSLLTQQTFASPPVHDLTLDEQTFGLFDWVPDGRRPRELPDDCSSLQLHKIILQNPTPSDRGQRLLNYFSRCEKYHTFLGESAYKALWNLFNIDYDYREIPAIQPINLKMRDGAIVHTLLALKPDNQPRPMIIVQCGLTCTTENSPSVRWPLMHLFDESPFHVLVVGSSTTAEFANTNKKFFAGGLQEGLYINEIAKWLKSPSSTVSDLISSIHVQGMSLGGHAALYSAIYAQDNDSDLIRSTQAYCPVVELKPAIDNIMRDTPPGRFLQSKVWAQMEQMIGQVPVIDRMIPNGKRPSTERTKEIVAQASLEYFGNNSVVKHFLNKLFRILTNFPTTIDDFWKFNRFSVLVENLKSPVIIWSADDDPAVLPSENSLTLLDYANKPGSTLTVLNTAMGSHCGFALSHGWDIYTTLMNSFVLAHSPEFQENYKMKRRTLDGLQSNEIILLPGQRHFSQAFRLEADNPMMKVTYTIFDPHKKKCGSADPFLTEEERCFVTQSTKVRIQDLQENLLYVPQSKPVAQMLTRWANANLKIVDRQGRRLVNSAQGPAFISWRELAH